MTFALLSAAHGLDPGLVRDWTTWLMCADTYYRRYTEVLNGFCPIGSQKTAAMVFLAAAAAKADFLTVVGSDVNPGYQNLPPCKVPGQAEIWLHTHQRRYSFEMRRARRKFTSNYLMTCLDYAHQDARSLHQDPSHHVSACLIASTEFEGTTKACEDFAGTDFADFSCRFGHSNKAIYAFFKLKSRP